MTDATSKTCTKCGETKALEEFSPSGKAVDGSQKYKSRCRKCCRDDQHEQRKDPLTRQKHRESSAAWRRKNLDAARAKDAEWRRQNPGKSRELSAAWRRDNQNRARANSNRWRNENRDKVRESNRSWSRRNPDRVRADNHRRRARLASATVEDFTPADMLADWADHDLYACFFCGGSLADGYHVEHFYPLKPADEDAPPGPHAVFNLVPACPTCNLSKGNRDPWAFLEGSLAARDVNLDECLTSLDAIMRRRR